MADSTQCSQSQSSNTTVYVLLSPTFSGHKMPGENGKKREREREKKQKKENERNTSSKHFSWALYYRGQMRQFFQLAIPNTKLKSSGWLFKNNIWPQQNTSFLTMAFSVQKSSKKRRAPLSPFFFYKLGWLNFCSIYKKNEKGSKKGPFFVPPPTRSTLLRAEGPSVSRLLRQRAREREGERENKHKKCLFCSSVLPPPPPRDGRSGGRDVTLRWVLLLPWSPTAEEAGDEWAD